MSMCLKIIGQNGPIYAPILGLFFRLYLQTLLLLQCTANETSAIGWLVQSLPGLPAAAGPGRRPGGAHAMCNLQKPRLSSVEAGAGGTVTARLFSKCCDHGWG